MAVEPRAIDRYGLQLALITGNGVTTLRLPFPETGQTSSGTLR